MGGWWSLVGGVLLGAAVFLSYLAGVFSARAKHAREVAEVCLLAKLAAQASAAGTVIAAVKGVDLEYVVPDEIEVGDRVSYWSRETGQVIEYEAGFNGDTGQQDGDEGEWFRHVER